MDELLQTKIMKDLTLEDLYHTLAFIGILIFIFLMIREVICWYYKINDRIKIQSEILQQLKILNSKFVPRNESNIAQQNEEKNESVIEEDEMVYLKHGKFYNDKGEMINGDEPTDATRSRE